MVWIVEQNMCIVMEVREQEWFKSAIHTALIIKMAPMLILLAILAQFHGLAVAGPLCGRATGKTSPYPVSSTAHLFFGAYCREGRSTVE